MSTLSEYYESNQKVNAYTMEAWDKTSRISFLKQFIQENTPKNGKILDVGCGDMYLSKILPDYDWTGIDINTVTNNSKAIKHDIEVTPYPLEGPYDTIICSEVLEHCFDPLKITKELYRLLATSGTYILSTPNMDWLQNYVDGYENLTFDLTKSWTKEHIHNYTLGSHDQILELAGFEIAQYTGADAHYGKLFHTASTSLFQWLGANYEKDLDKAERLAYVLVGNMFKNHSHTLVIVARKK
jgi:SAM-dependent methyltransferase